MVYSYLLTVITTTLIYGFLYSLFDQRDFGFKHAIDPYYFSFTTMSTVGYGDFSPTTTKTKILVMSQQLLLLGKLYLVIIDLYLKK
jgi:voltage-gated potassium channel